MTYFDFPSVYKSLIDLICKNVGYSSTVFTDEYRAYDSLEEHGFTHKSVNHSEKEYANGIFHVNNCDCRSNLYQLWMRKFMGVNKHNLETYSKHSSSFITIKEPRQERKGSRKSCIISN